MPNITRGGNTTGLMLYLVGPGRANEHENPHVIAASDRVPFDESVCQLSKDDALSLASQLDTYMNFHDVTPLGNVTVYDYETDTRHLINRSPNHVWHCSLSLSPDEPALSDSQWADIAHDFMHEMGFTAESGHAPAPWVAIHHGASKAGGDHVHIVANVVRQDGTKVDVFRDYKRAQQACNMLEHKYGLAVVEGREHGRGSINDKARALNDAAKRGKPTTERAALETRVRAAATAARSEADFVRLVKQTGVRIRPYFARGTTDVVTGYSVALHTNEGQRPTWYSGGRLARDLTLPRLRQRWEDSALASLDASHTWKQAWRGPGWRPMRNWRKPLDALDQVCERIHATDYTDPIKLADLTQDIAGIYSAAAVDNGNTPVGRAFDMAARQLGRAAQVKVRPPAANPTDLNARFAASVFLMQTSRDDALAKVVVMMQMMRLVQSLAQLYEAAQQARTAQVLLRDTQAAFERLHQRIDAAGITAAVDAKRQELTSTPLVDDSGNPPGDSAAGAKRQPQQKSEQMIARDIGLLTMPAGSRGWKLKLNAHPTPNDSDPDVVLPPVQAPTRRGPTL